MDTVNSSLLGWKRLRSSQCSQPSRLRAYLQAGGLCGDRRQLVSQLLQRLGKFPLLLRQRRVQLGARRLQPAGEPCLRPSGELQMKSA